MPPTFLPHPLNPPSTPPKPLFPGQAPCPHQGLIGALKDVADELEASTLQGLPADKSEVVDMADTLQGATELGQYWLQTQYGSLPHQRSQERVLSGSKLDRTPRLNRHWP